MRLDPADDAELRSVETTGADVEATKPALDTCILHNMNMYLPVYLGSILSDSCRRHPTAAWENPDRSLEIGSGVLNDCVFAVRGGGGGVLITWIVRDSEAAGAPGFCTSPLQGFSDLCPCCSVRREPSASCRLVVFSTSDSPHQLDRMVWVS